MIINEFTRKQLITKSKSPGFNRYKSRTQVTNQEVEIDRVGLLELTSQSSDLDVYFVVHGYRVSIRFVNFMRRVKLLLERSKYRNDLRAVITLALNQTIDHNNVLINCSCPDFYYRFSYTATIKGFGFNTNQLIPAFIRNPKNKGSGCKHIIKVLNAPSVWKRKVISAVYRAIKYDPSIIGQ